MSSSEKILPPASFTRVGMRLRERMPEEEGGMKLTTSTRRRALLPGRIYGTEYFAVLRQPRIRTGVARWRGDAFLNIRSIFCHCIALSVVGTRSNAVRVRALYGIPYPNIPSVSTSLNVQDLPSLLSDSRLYS